jgi:hypothetical protein
MQINFFAQARSGRKIDIPDKKKRPAFAGRQGHGNTFNECLFDR